MPFNQKIILALLTTITNSHFFIYDNDTTKNGSWGFPILKEDYENDVNSLTSLWCLNFFIFSELPKQMKIDGFTEQKIPSIKQIPQQKYYLKYSNIDLYNDVDILFPETIDMVFTY